MGLEFDNSLKPAVKDQPLNEKQIEQQPNKTIPSDQTEQPNKKWTDEEIKKIFPLVEHLPAVVIEYLKNGGSASAIDQEKINKINEELERIHKLKRKSRENTQNEKKISAKLKQNQIKPEENKKQLSEVELFEQKYNSMTKEQRMLEMLGDRVGEYAIAPIEKYGYLKGKIKTDNPMFQLLLEHYGFYEDNSNGRIIAMELTDRTPEGRELRKQLSDYWQRMNGVEKQQIKDALYEEMLDRKEKEYQEYQKLTYEQKIEKHYQKLLHTNDTDASAKQFIETVDLASNLNVTPKTENQKKYINNYAFFLQKTGIKEGELRVTVATLDLENGTTSTHNGLFLGELQNEMEDKLVEKYNKNFFEKNYEDFGVELDKDHEKISELKKGKYLVIYNDPFTDNTLDGGNIYHIDENGDFHVFGEGVTKASTADDPKRARIDALIQRLTTPIREKVTKRYVEKMGGLDNLVNKIKKAHEEAFGVEKTSVYNNKSKEQLKSYLEGLVKAVGFDTEVTTELTNADYNSYGRINIKQNVLGTVDAYRIHVDLFDKPSYRQGYEEVKYARRINAIHHEFSHLIEHGQWEGTMRENSGVYMEINEFYTETMARFLDSQLGYKTPIGLHPYNMYQVLYAPAVLEWSGYKDCKTLRDIGEQRYKDAMAGKTVNATNLISMFLPSSIKRLGYYERYFSYIKKNMQSLSSQIAESTVTEQLTGQLAKNAMNIVMIGYDSILQYNNDWKNSSMIDFMNGMSSSLRNVLSAFLLQAMEDIGVY